MFDPSTMEDYYNHYNRFAEDYFNFNEPSSSHWPEPNALKRAADSIMYKSVNMQHKKNKICQLNNDCYTQMYTHSKMPNENRIQPGRYSKPDYVALALQSVMSQMGNIVKEHVSDQGDKRKLVKKKLYNLINTRILSMPIVKIANSHKDIVRQYYKEYPFSKDKDVMRIFKEEEYSPDVPLKYNNENIANISILPQPDKICKIFETKLEKSLDVNMLGMIKNLGNYYQNEREILQCIDELPDMDDLSDKEEETSRQPEENISKNEVQMTNTGNEGDANKMSEAEKKILSEYYKIIDDILTPKILQYLHKYKHEFEQILNNDIDYLEAKTKIMIELKDKMKDSLDDTDDDVEIISVEEDVISINSDSDDEVIRNAKEKENIPEPNTESRKKVTPTFTEFKNSEENKTNNVSDVSTAPKDAPLLVKLIGNPTLPPRQMLHTFLRKFNPALVKHHKFVDNLLVIGFNNKQDYNNIIEANKSRVGDSIIFIIAIHTKNTNNNKIDKNHDTPKKIVDDAVAKLTIESDATNKSEEIVIESTKRTKNNMESDQTIVIDDDEDYGDVLLIDNDTELTFEENTEKKEKKVNKKTDHATVSRDTNHITNTTPSQIKFKFLTMLIGRPTLPEKVFMDDFLSRFNPVSIKKHKIVSNVLLVGFNNKMDYDNILAANESKVGSSIFIIKPKDVNSPSKQDNKSLPKNHSADNKKTRQDTTADNKKTRRVYVINVDSSVTENSLINCTDSKREKVLCQRDDLKKSEIDKEKSYLEAKVDDMMNKKISETISKVGQINKKTGSELWKCKAEANEKAKELDSIINASNTDEYNNEEIKKIVEEAFIKKLHLLEDNMVSLLREDEEYNAVKSIILKNVESMKTNKESRVESDCKDKNETNSKDMNKIPKDVKEIVTDKLLGNSIAKPSYVDSLKNKDRLSGVDENINAAKDVFVEHDGSQKEDNSKITSVANTNIHGNKLNSSEQNDLNTLNSIPIVDKNDNIPNNLQGTERLDHSESIELKSKDEKIDKEKQTNENEVRLLSLPKLPSNELLRGFLSKYSIRYKKKHKKHSNLLIIGLADKTEYHSILAMDGTSIGDVKFIIRPSVS